jgi:hypothetical protein
MAKQHKLVRAIEQLSLKDASDADAKRENANIDGDTAMGTMLQFGSTVSREFTKSYLMEIVFQQLMMMVLFMFMIWIFIRWELQQYTN